MYVYIYIYIYIYKLFINNFSLIRIGIITSKLVQSFQRPIIKFWTARQFTVKHEMNQIADISPDKPYVSNFSLWEFRPWKIMANRTDSCLSPVLNVTAACCRPALVAYCLCLKKPSGVRHKQHCAHASCQLLRRWQTLELPQQHE
jgi:hypothetical protein